MPDGSASGAHNQIIGHYLVGDIPRAEAKQRAGDVIEAMRGRRFDWAGAVCVTGPDGRFLGLVPITALLAAAPDAPVGGLMRPGLEPVAPDLDREDAASLAIACGADALAVVDRDGRFAGVVPAASMLGILREEHLEDLHRMTGMIRHAGEAAGALESPPISRVRHRLPWLLLGLAGSALATLVMTRFEAALDAHVAIAFFVPAIVYLADAIGTQSEAIAVRGLSLSSAGLARLLRGEIVTGTLLGAIMAGIAWPAIWLTFGDGRLALAVSSALLAAGAVAATMGLLLPWLFEHAGFDPADGSGPVGTIIQDVASLLIYFGCVSLMLG
jgi:magnesium transporter